MSRCTVSPLVDVAISYMMESCGDLKSYDLALLRASFDGYINHITPKSELSALILKYSDNLTPLERLDEILACADEPAPEVPELPTNIGEDGSKIRRKTRSWNSQEDQRLLFAVHKHGVENWTLVAQFVGGGRTRSMCSQRWIRVLDPRISKSQWTPEEEQKLVKLVGIYGEKSWMRVATELGNRSDVQCRYRYMQIQKGMVSDKQEVVPQAIPAIHSMPEVQKEQCLKFEPIAPEMHQLRLEEPFPFTSSFEIFASDPLFDSAFLF